jgi:23S rRNA (guanosine2251-2'-O)-methyltransferase
LGVHGVIIEKTRACQVNETVIKTSAGATSYVKVARVANINNEIEKLKKQNVWVYACELGGEPLSKANLTGPIAIVIGSEGRGTGKLTLKTCDGTVTIPQFGKINSLNASVATGIILYEVRRQRG